MAGVVCGGIVFLNLLSYVVAVRVPPPRPALGLLISLLWPLFIPLALAAASVILSAIAFLKLPES